jgi:hypothetical protein
MANLKTREDRFMQKKTECFFAGEVNEGTESYEIDTADTETDNLIAYLPPDSIITNAYIHVKTVSDAVTSAVGTLGTTDGGSEILSAADLDAATGKTGTFTGQSLTGSGVGLYFRAAYTGAVTNVGEYIVVVEYLEYTKNNGEYTKV